MKSKNKFFDYLVFIPAKGTSSGLKNKNLKKIGKLTLLEKTIKFAKKIPVNKLVFVSTDSKKIQKISKKNKAKCDFLRSKILSKKDSDIKDALIEFFDKIEKEKKPYIFKKIIILMPTQPFRKMNDLIKGTKLLQKKIKSVVSVKNLERSDNFIWKLKKNLINLKNNLIGENRQFINKINYTPCGSFYILWTKDLKKMNRIFIKPAKYVVTKFPYNLDINEEIDLKISNKILEII